LDISSFSRSTSPKPLSPGESITYPNGSQLFCVERECRLSDAPGGQRPFPATTPIPAGKLIADYLLKNNRVRINDGAIYGGPEGCRINLACPEATMKEGLRRIAEGLDLLIG